MDAVALIQVATPGNLVEEEREQGHALLSRDRRIDGVEFRGIPRAQVGQSLHLDEQYGRVGAFRLYPVERRLEVRAQGGRGDSAETVVRPGLDDEHIERPAEKPIQPVEETRRRFATHAGVDYLKWKAR